MKDGRAPEEKTKMTRIRKYVSNPFLVVVSAALSGIIFTGCSDDDNPLAPENPVEPAGQRVTELVTTNPEFSTLAAAVDAAELAATLNSDGPFTVFAPTNAAFEKIPPATVEYLLANKDELAKVLLYHIVPGKVASGEIGSLIGSEVETALAGQKVAIGSTSEGVGVKINESVVTSVDIEASNGIVHVIDTVLLPSNLNVQTIADLVTGNPDFSTLAAAVNVAGLGMTLASDGPFTVFAPTNAAFDKLEAANPGILASLLADPATLSKVLLYHVVADKVTSGEVAPLVGESVPTALEGQYITVASSTEGVGIKVNEANITEVDILATNGVVHVIDSVLVPVL
jgi:uncharacterized surface protein with fasciclin (FAS1) repeats